ncbi:MAG: RluA family pseudouridine synthase [Planctomycetaceae bacterium]
MDEQYTSQFTVEADLHGVRIDSFLVRHFRNYTSWRMQRLAAAGQVWINHAAASPTQRVFVGETVRVRLIEPPDKLLPPEPVPFRLVYEDAWLMVVEKPAGVVAHPTGEFQSGSLANGLQAYLDDRTPVRGLIRPGLPHRLDRQTSGLMVIATHHRSHAALSTAFESGRVSKSYLAIVEGIVKRPEGTIELPIGRDRADRRVLMSARADAINPRPAKTPYCVEERFARHTLVRARPLTGRNHQIRVHFAHIGHPLLGDEFYDRHGTFKPWRTDAEQPLDGEVDSEAPEIDAPETGSCFSTSTLLGTGRHALHAASLSFAHPITDVWLTFGSPLPADLRRTVEALRLPAQNNLPVAKTLGSE